MSAVTKEREATMGRPYRTMEPSGEPTALELRHVAKSFWRLCCEGRLSLGSLRLGRWARGEKRCRQDDAHAPGTWHGEA